MHTFTIKNFAKALCFIILLVVISAKTTAQNKSTLIPNIIPPSPEAASLGKFVEVPVSYYTGLPDINVPLYTIESGEIKLPIDISYHARGVLVSEIASQVGTGWTLKSAGAIIRQVRGRADEVANGYLSQNYYSTFFTSEATRKAVFDLSHLDEGENIIDLEPDQYFFNFLNFSGKFVFDQRTKKPIIQKFSDFKIEPIYETLGYYRIKGWVVTDKDGIQYYFGTSKDGLRTAIDRAQTISTYTYVMQGGGPQAPEPSSPSNNAWQLMDIITPTKKHIKFEYVQDKPIYFVKSYDEGPASKITSVFSRMNMNQYHIKAIYFDKGKVLFTKSSTVREDLANSYALEKVEVFGNDNILKIQHRFKYSYTTSEDINSYYILRDEDPQSKKRMFLESIITKGNGTESKEKKHSFVYNSAIVPNRFSTAQDNWGYYNGKNNGPFSSFFEKDDRTVDTIKSQAGMLKKIIYPTGGSASFEYEHNLVIPPFYYDNLLTDLTNPLVDKGVSIRKDKKLYKNGRYSIPFTIGPEATSRKIEYKSMIPDPERVCSSSANTRGCPFFVAVYRANPMSAMGSLYVGDKQHILLDPGDYILEVDPETDEGKDTVNDEVGNFSVRLWWQEVIKATKDTVGTKLLYGAGKRIKRIVWEDNQGGTTSKTYKYLDGSGKSSGKTFSLPNMYYVSREFNGIPVLDQFGATAGSPLTNFQGNSIGYSFVTEFNGENNNNVGKTEYTFTIPDDSGDFYRFPYHSPTDNEWLRGMPLNTKYYANNQGNYSPVKEVINTYLYGDMMNDPMYFAGMLDPDTDGYSNHKRKFSMPLIIFTKSINSSGNAPFNSHNSFKTFYATGGTVDLSNSEEIEFMTDSPNYKKNTKYAYNYDFGYQLKSTETKSSTKETLVSNYFYPQDPKMSGEPFVNELIAANRIGTPLVTQSLKNGLKLSEQKTVYGKDVTTGNLVLPKYIYSNKGTAVLTSIDKKITFDQYDDKGNLVQYTTEGGMPVSIIWGYTQTQPIAKIENIAYNSILAGTISSLQMLSDADIDNCMTVNCTEQSLINGLNGLRDTFPDAMITTYTYNSLVGVTSITDPKGATSYYDYDSLNRLKFVRDRYFNILQMYCYNYQGEQNDCSDMTSSGATIYKSTAKSGTFTKSDCSLGGTPSAVVYSVVAGKYSSAESQDAADSKAQDDVNTNGPLYANAQGYCTFQSVAISGSFQKNNCSVGGVGSYVPYSLGAGSVTLNTSQADVDAKALAKLNAEGLANANAQGDCTFQSAALKGNFQKNNCSVGLVGSYVPYSLGVGVVTLKTSQADVDAKASLKFNEEGRNYANTNGLCLYPNVEKTGKFIKNDCPDGKFSDNLNYTILAGRFTAPSQAEADNLALQALNEEGQANANSTGTCKFFSVYRSRTLAKNDCLGGGIGSNVTLEFYFGAYRSDISQADADSKPRGFINDMDFVQSYANDNGTCLYYNVAKSGTFTKNNCPGGIPSSVVYTVPARKYSADSQIGADNLAQADVNANGLAYANANGDCTFQSVALSGSFQKVNCPAGGVGTYVTYSLGVGAITLKTSQADVDAKAQQKLNAEGPGYANTQGSCTFQSAAISGSFQKNNCSVGGVGSYVSYSLGVGAVTLNTSQADVDAKALAKLNTEGLVNANAQGDCTFQSVAISGSFQKNNCPVGGVGSYVSYSLGVGAITLNTSQGDVDAKAAQKLNAEGTAYANTYGNCTFYNVARSGTYTKNNCPWGGSGETLGYTVIAGRFAASSQAEADNLALTALNAEGLANANANGKCTFYNTYKSRTLTKNDCPGGVGSTETFEINAGRYSSTISQADADQQALKLLNNLELVQNYVNGAGVCTFYSVAKSGTFARNNCAGGTPSSVIYSVAARQYSSTYSQAEADNLAQADVNNNGPSYANAHGICTFYNVARSEVYYRNNCGVNGVSGYIVYTIPAGKYASTESQVAANNMAQAELNANAQAKANTDASCIYKNVAMTKDFTKRFCGSGYTGTSRSYTVAAGIYSSNISQADADAKALDVLNREGQANADAKGSCLKDYDGDF